MNKKILIIGTVVIILTLGIGLTLYYFRDDIVGAVPTNTGNTSIIYNNNDYGFTFSLPADWQGYSIVKETWIGNSLKATVAQSGSKLLIRNPKWTMSAPYEDLPILIFTSSQWNAYLAGDFSVSAAPITATELGRNNKYVFALPPRWDFDYSLDYKQAQDIIAGNPLRAFNLETVDMLQGKLNINFVCEQVLTYMSFADAKSADAFVADCKEGKHPEVIEKYKVDMNLGDGAEI
ncbi:MAG: hypothetical protein RLZZ67_339 [Candidatus Parcubacteria bacterium]|jgi:hypothetical protein